MLKIKDNVDLKELEKFGFSREAYIVLIKKYGLKLILKINTNIVMLLFLKKIGALT